MPPELDAKAREHREVAEHGQERVIPRNQVHRSGGEVSGPHDCIEHAAQVRRDRKRGVGHDQRRPVVRQREKLRALGRIERQCLDDAVEEMRRHLDLARLLQPGVPGKADARGGHAGGVARARYRRSPRGSLDTSREVDDRHAVSRFHDPPGPLDPQGSSPAGRVARRRVIRGALPSDAARRVRAEPAGVPHVHAELADVPHARAGQASDVLLEPPPAHARARPFAHSICVPHRRLGVLAQSTQDRRPAGDAAR